MIIYNFVQYIRNLFPSETIDINVAQKENAELIDRLIVVTDETGGETPYVQFATKLISIWVREVDPPKAFHLSWELFNSLSNCYKIELPAVTVDGNIYPQAIIGAINPGQHPYNMGPDSEGRIRFQFSVELKYRRA